MATGDETQAGPRPSLPPHRPGSLGSDDALTRQAPAISGASTPLPPGSGAPVQPPDRFGSSFPDADVPPRQNNAPKPQILAPQANDWETNKQEVEVVKSRRTGLILLFLMALLLVALIALGLAALSVFNGGDDLPEGAATDTDSSVPGDDVSVDGETTIAPPVETTIVDPNLLDVEVTENPFICDDVTRPFAQLSGASPNEEVAFSSPQTENLLSGTADANGALPIRWSCSPDQAGTTWELTASGVTSGKAVTFIFAGVLAADAPAPAPGTTSLTANLIENPFLCNSESRIFGGLSGAEPNEEVSFTSPQASGISNGVADANGDLSIRWSCTPDRAGTTWELTATGLTSGRVATFSFTGS